MLGVFRWVNALSCYAIDKFEVLPDLPDSLVYTTQSAQAATVSGTTNNAIDSAQTIGHEPSILSVLFSLLIVIVLIYLTGIIYAKLNRVGFNTLKKQQGDLAKSHVSVISTTQLGSNKTLHVVELDGKRMLIGASSSAIQLIKDLGSTSTGEFEEEYSRIEIPNIKIPKIEIPKIEIPSIGFSKMVTKTHKNLDSIENTEKNEVETNNNQNKIQEELQHNEPEETSDVIIDSLFANNNDNLDQEVIEEPAVSEHKVDPEDFSLYK